MEHFIGIDFGTTNSAVGIATGDGPPRLLPFPGQRAEQPTWRSVLYFEPVAGPRERGVSAGSIAIAKFIENEGEGRLVQSIKSYLASNLFSTTQILGRNWTLEELIATYLDNVRDAVGMDLGRRAVVGRPVRYWGAETEDDQARALARMRKALAGAGFDEVVFEYEPIAAASLYASRIGREELVLIADFGGGTSDFSLVRVGPRIEPGDPDAILATGGIGIGGDTFDSRIVDAIIAPLLGKGTSFRDEFGGEMPVPPWIFHKLRRWHHLSFLKSPRTLALLDRIQTGATAPEKIRNLMAVIDGDLGLPLHQAIERTKIDLSREPEAMLRFVREPLALSAHIDRERFDGWIEAELERLDTIVGDVLGRAGVEPQLVDRVFTTGGSSFVPAVRQRLRDRFGPDKVVGGSELTSVAWGLAARARTVFKAA